MLWKKDIADPALNYTATGAPLALKDKVIVGMAGGESGGTVDSSTRMMRKPGSGSGAFGQCPALVNLATIPGAAIRGSTAAAPRGSLALTIPILNLVYWGTGNPGPDYNGDVRPGDNLFTCSLLALDADTGKR